MFLHCHWMRNPILVAIVVVIRIRIRSFTPWNHSRERVLHIIHNRHPHLLIRNLEMWIFTSTEFDIHYRYCNDTNTKKEKLIGHLENGSCKRPEPRSKPRPFSHNSTRDLYCVYTYILSSATKVSLFLLSH